MRLAELCELGLTRVEQVVERRQHIGELPVLGTRAQ
jgi:hypothetical protein